MCQTWWAVCWSTMVSKIIASSTREVSSVTGTQNPQGVGQKAWSYDSL